MIGRERGAVLVMALLIVAAVASLAVSFAGSFQLSLARGENRWHGAQANAYLVGAESLGVLALERDREDDEKEGAVDHLQEIWAQPAETFPVEGGWVRASVEDAQGRFNLNSLTEKVSGGSRATLADRFTEPQKRFIRLLQTFEEVPLTLDEAVAITEAMIDWLDRDDTETGFGGAESSFYGQQERAYAPANALFTSATELRLIRGITPALYRELLPLVVVLPKEVPLNVNTAKQPLLRTMQHENELQPLPPEDAERLVSARPNEGYQNVREFSDGEAMRTSLPQGAVLPEEGLAVASSYFLVHAESQLVRQRRRLTSLLKRPGEGDITPIQRWDQ